MKLVLTTQAARGYIATIKVIAQLNYNFAQEVYQECVAMDWRIPDDWKMEAHHVIPWRDKYKQDLKQLNRIFEILSAPTLSGLLHNSGSVEFSDEELDLFTRCSTRLLEVPKISSPFIIDLK